MKATQKFYISKNGDVMRIYKLADGEQIYRKISFESGNLPEDWNKDGEWEEMNASCFRPRVEGMMGSTVELSVEELDDAKQKMEADYELLKACEGESFYEEHKNEYYFIRGVYSNLDYGDLRFEATKVNATALTYDIDDYLLAEGEEFVSMEDLKKRLKPISFAEFVEAVKRVDENFIASHKEIHNNLKTRK